MKLLLFSDLHTDTRAATRLVDLAREADVVIGAGDFANARRGISTCIEILKEIRIPTILVPGWCCFGFTLAAKGFG
jgi:predicted phosphodiesterase